MSSCLLPDRKFFGAAVATGCILLASCTVGPKYQRPVTPAPPQYKEGAAPATGVANPIAYSNWWLIFHDDQLNRLERQVDASDQDIKAAMARVEQAQAYARVSRSYLFPSISAGASGSRSREAQNRPNNGNTGGAAATYNDFQLSMLLGYEVDLWGKIRHSVEAASANEQSNEANLHFVRLVAETDLAMDYFGVCELDAERQVLSATVQALQQAEQLTELRRKGGLASDYDVYQAKTLLDQTDAQAQHIEIQRAQFEHVIAVLSGQPASTFSLPRTPLTAAAPAIPAGIPSDVVEHRPDIQMVERTLASANAQIGVARALQFPQVTLSAAAGFETVNPASILAWQNSLASLGSGILAPVFTGGRLKAQVDETKAAYRQTLAQYQGSVLKAFQEVEDQLAAIRILSGEATATRNAVDDAEHTEQIALNQYKSGLVNYLNVANAQATLLYNQRTQTQILGEQMVASVGLIKALGGGWTGVTNPATN